jgi:hypothetical protein
VAAICCEVLTTTLVESVATETVIAGTLIVPEVVFVASATDVAVTVTRRSFCGGVVGAV